MRQALAKVAAMPKKVLIACKIFEEELTTLLEREGVVFRENGTLDLERYRWIPPELRGRSDPAPVGKKPAKRR